MTTLLDTSMLIGLMKPSDQWHSWAEKQYPLLKLQGPLLLVDIVFAEWSIAMKDRAEVDATIAALGLECYPCGDDALYRAGQAYREYKDKRDGPGKRVLPDMIIGAIAEVNNLPIVTANPKDFRSYFPSVGLIEPPEDEPRVAKSSKG